MRIGHYAPDIWAPGGTSTYIRRLGNAQTRQGHDVLYLTATPGSGNTPETIVVENERSLFDRAETKNLDLLHLHKAVAELPNDRIPTIRTMHDNQGSCPSGSRYLRRQGTPCDREYGIGTCVWGHLVDHCGSRRPSKLIDDFRTIEHEIRQAHELTTLTVSKFVKDQMTANGCPAEQMHVLHSPAPQPPREFTPPPSEGSPRFVFLGRIEPEKGVDWLLKAAAEVGPHIHIDIAGTGRSEYIDQLHDLIDTLEIDSRVTFHGWLQDPAVITLMKKARAVVVPSVWHEPAGLVTLEAAAAGRPVIASDVGGITEYATDEFALHVEPRNIEGLAERLALLAQNREVAVEMGRNGRTVVSERHSMDAFLKRLHAQYHQVITPART